MHTFAIGDIVVLPSGLSGRVTNANCFGRVTVEYMRMPPWQPPAVKGGFTSHGALEVTLQPALLKHAAAWGYKA